MPVVDTTRTFTNNEQITSTKLNEIMDNSLFVAGAVVSGQGLEVTAGGQMQIQNAGITPAKLSNSDFGDFTISGGVATIDNGVVTPAKLSQPLTSTATQSLVGSSIDFSSIPSWVRKITIIVSDLSFSGTDDFMVRIGTASGVETTSYLSRRSAMASAVTSNSSTNGFIADAGIATRKHLYTITLSLVNSATNTWVFALSGCDDTANSLISNGSKSLTGALTTIRLMPTTTNTFDSGVAVVIYQ